MLSKKISSMMVIVSIMSTNIYAAKNLQDCSNSVVMCTTISQGTCNFQGELTVGFCWNWKFLDCEPCANVTSECNARFPSCEGQCQALSSDGINGQCDQGPSSTRHYPKGLTVTEIKNLEKDKQARKPSKEELEKRVKQSQKQRQLMLKAQQEKRDQQEKNMLLKQQKLDLEQAKKATAAATEREQKIKQLQALHQQQIQTLFRQQQERKRLEKARLAELQQQELEKMRK